MLAPMKDRSLLRAAFLTVVCGLVAIHLVAVTFAAIPPNRYSDAVEPSRGYLTPYFTQNWRLFAPNPVAQDRSVRFQMAYRDEAGDVQQTKWVDWTSVELDLVHHRLVGGRAGYVTNKMIEALGRTYQAMSTEQRHLLSGTSDETPLSWTSLDTELASAGVPTERRQAFLRYERAAARLATDVGSVRFPGREIVAVRYSVVLQPVTPYAARKGSEAERDAARPDASERLSGWRAPLPGSAAELRAVAGFDARHR